MRDNKQLATFFVKISKVFNFLNITDDKDEIIKNLIGSSIVNFGRIMAGDDKTAPYLQDYSQVGDADPEKLFSFLDSKGVNYKTIFDQSQKETLQSFVSELTPDLTSEKIRELNRIISE